MTKDELAELVDHVNASWNVAPFKDDLTKQRKAWWHFLHDLELGAVMKVVDRLAVVGGFPPRPGDVRRETVIGKVPLAIEAWNELQSAREAVYAGGMATPLSEPTRLTVERLGGQAKGMHTNGDRDKFTEVYDAVVKEWLGETCLP